jgi:phosphate/sulfate permease
MLTNLIPSRELSIEFGAAITIIIGSRIGLSVSTTHRQVGATMSVGLVELKTSTVN